MQPACSIDEPLDQVLRFTARRAQKDLGPSLHRPEGILEILSSLNVSQFPGHFHLHEKPRGHELFVCPWPRI